MEACETLRSHKNYEKIIPLCTSELELDESKFKAQAYHLRAVFKFLFGYKYEDVASDLEAVVNDPGAPKTDRCYCYIKMGAFRALHDVGQDYEDCFKKVGSQYCLIMLIQILGQCDIYEIGMSDLQAEELSMNNVDLLMQRGQVALTRGDIGASVADLSKAIELCPQFIMAAGTRWYVSYRHGLATNDNELRQRSIHELKKISESTDCVEAKNLYAQVMF